MNGRMRAGRTAVWLGLIVVVLGVGLVLLGGRGSNELKMCASAQLYFPYAAGKEFYELDRMGSPPRREKFAEMIQTADFQKRTKGCPKGGKLDVTVKGEGSMMDAATYSTKCSIHGTPDDLKKALGEADFKKVESAVQTGAKFM